MAFGLQPSHLLVLLLLGAAMWFWRDNLRAREIAIATAARVCRDTGCQLLDQTVAIHRLGLGRSPRGMLSLRRQYRFEFSVEGADRHLGWAVLLGRRVESIELEHPGGRIINR
jgi:hypothetical protein